MPTKRRPWLRPSAALRFVTHSKKVQMICSRRGWLPGARYTNLRDVREFDSVAFIDIDWKSYDFDRHLAATRQVRPMVTIARDVVEVAALDEILRQAFELARFADRVVIVPKDR